MKFKIYDWAGNECLTDLDFNSFEDAWDYIYSVLPNANEEDFGEYYVLEKQYKPFGRRYLSAFGERERGLI